MKEGKLDVSFPETSCFSLLMLDLQKQNKFLLQLSAEVGP